MISDFLGVLVKYQVINYIIPFLLVFSLVYAILLKSKFLGDPSAKKEIKRVYIVVALAFGIASIMPHYLKSIGQDTGVPDLVEIIMTAFPQVSILLMVVLSVFILLGFFGAKLNLMDTGMGAGILMFLIAIVVFVFLRAGNLIGPQTPIIGNMFNSQNSSELWSLITAIAVFGLVVWFIVRDEKPKGQENVGQKLAKLFDKE